MGLRIEDEGLIRGYLLGQLTEHEREQLEKRMMTDSELYDQMLLAEDQMVEDYIQGQLSGRDREAFEASYLSTADGREQVSFDQALRKYIAAKAMARAPAPAKVVSGKFAWRQQASFGTYARLAAAIIVLGIGFGIWRIFFYQSEVSKGMAALAYAYREQRPVEARISGFTYAPAVNTRGGEEKVDRDARNRAERILLDAKFEDPGSASRHALGKLYLAEGKFDDAIELFEEAVKEDPNNAQLHSDYGAALLEKGRSMQKKDPGSGVQQFAQSLSNLTRAIELKDSLLEARFNLALLYEDMKLIPEAKEQWRRYLQRDSTSEWAGEANRNLQRLEKQATAPKSIEDSYREFIVAFESRDDESAWDILRRSRAGTGNLITDRLVSEYLDLKAAGDATADVRIRQLHYAGNLELIRAADSYTSSLARVYGSGSSATISTLIRARDLMAKGRRSYEQSNSEDAIQHYVEARRAFKNAGDGAEATYVDYRIGHCYLALSKSQQSLQVFERLAGDCERAGYRWLLAQARYSMAILQIALNKYSAALDISNGFLRLSQELGDPVGVVNAIQQIGQEYLFLNNYAQSLSFHGRSLSELIDCDIDPLQKWRAYFYISLPLNRLGLQTAAVEYQKEALRLALELGRPLPVCRSYVNLGLMYGARGEYREALDNMHHAFDVAESLPSPLQRKENLAYASLQAGHLSWKAGDPADSLANYSRASDLYKELDYDAFKYSALKGKLLSCLSLGGCSSVDEDIENGMNLFEEYRAKIVEQSNRDSFFDVEQDLYDAAIDYKCSKGDFETAFEYAERSRARSLFDIAKDRVATSEDAELRFHPPYNLLSAHKLCELLPRGVQILQYSVLNDKVIIFTVTSSGIAQFQSQISSTELEEVVNRFRQSISVAHGDDEEAKRTGKLLYRILIEPVETLDNSKLLCLIPDKFLWRLSFGAMVSPSDTYLAEDHALSYAPSTNMFVVSTESASRRQTASEEKAVCVGDPAFDLSRFAPLKYLPDAGEEATQTADCYRNSERLLGENATKTRVLTAISNADVADIATHAVTDNRSPLRSKLLLATEPGKSSETAPLHAFEICKIKFAKTRLVVLAACNTGTGPYYGGEGVISLSRSFLAARVPLVVASLWAVDSEATASLMIKFHKLRRGGLSTVAALKRAQIKMMQGPDERWKRPYYWASFIVVGGFATF